LDPTEACANVTAVAVAGAVGAAAGKKAAYFAALRRATGTRLTGLKAPASKVALTHAHAKGARAGQVLFVGDSIVRELAESFGRLTRKQALARGSLLHRAYDANDLPRGHWEGAGDQQMASLRRHFATGMFDLAVVGGFGLHYLLRVHRLRPSGVVETTSGANPALPALAAYGQEPTEVHRLNLRSRLATLAALGKEFGVAVAIVGTPLVDAATLHLAPAKQDWNDFFDLSLAAVWDGVEADELRHSKKVNPSYFQRHNPNPEVIIPQGTTSSGTSKNSITRR
jgi:hypothetical protein